MPSLGPIFGNTPFSQEFTSSNDGSGKEWQPWQYFFASFSPAATESAGICLWD
jgi:hypothetical protein